MRRPAMPRVAPLWGPRPPWRSGADGTLTLRFVVDSAGRVLPGTVGVVSSALKMRELEIEVLRAFPRARFTAGRAGGRSVSVMVQFTLRYSGEHGEERWDSFCQLVTGP